MRREPNEGERFSPFSLSADHRSDSCISLPSPAPLIPLSSTTLSPTRTDMCNPNSATITSGWRNPWPNVLDAPRNNERQSGDFSFCHRIAPMKIRPSLASIVCDFRFVCITAIVVTFSSDCYWTLLRKCCDGYWSIIERYTRCTISVV